MSESNYVNDSERNIKLKLIYQTVITASLLFENEIIVWFVADMKEQLYSWMFKFCKVMWQQIWGEVGRFYSSFFCNSSQNARVKEY